MSDMKKKTPKLLRDGLWEDSGRYVRTWREGKGRQMAYMIRIWNAGKVVGECNGDWAMPGILGLGASVDQALIQTPKAGDRK